MAKLKGCIVSGTYKASDTYNYQDPATGQVRPLRSLKIHLEHDDGTITKESISVPQDQPMPRLEVNKDYAFPVRFSVSKKKGTLQMTLRTDLQPFESPDIG